MSKVVPILNLPRSLVIICVATGVTYGIIARFVFGNNELQGAFEIMSVSFIFIVPIVIGYLAVHLAPSDEVPGWWKGFWLPWIPSLLTIGITLLLAWEGLICAIVWVPLFLFMSTIGGLLAGAVKRSVDSASTRGMMLASLVIFPFILSPFEQQFEPYSDYHLVENRIEIDAPPAAIWAQIREVAPIREDEMEWSFSHWVGFPKPIEAKLVGAYTALWTNFFMSDIQETILKVIRGRSESPLNSPISSHL